MYLAGTIAPQARDSGSRTPAAVLQKLRDCAPEIEKRSATLDKLGAFPVEDVALLADIGALEIFATETPTPLELMESLRLVGRANLSIGRIFEGHVNGARLIGW